MQQHKYCLHILPIEWIRPAYIQVLPIESAQYCLHVLLFILLGQAGMSCHELFLAFGTLVFPREEQELLLLEHVVWVELDQVCPETIELPFICRCISIVEYD